MTGNPKLDAAWGRAYEQAGEELRECNCEFSGRDEPCPHCRALTRRAEEIMDEWNLRAEHREP